jgi:hypothetical protein
MIDENAIKNNASNTADKPESRPPPALTFYYLDDITEILDYFKKTIVRSETWKSSDK